MHIHASAYDTVICHYHISDLVNLQSICRFIVVCHVKGNFLGLQIIIKNETLINMKNKFMKS